MKRTHHIAKNPIIKMSRSGATLVEVLIYIAVFGIMIGAIVNFQVNLISTRVSKQRILEVNDQGSAVVKLVTQTLRNASLVNSPTIGATADSVSMATTAPTTNPTVFSLSNGVLYITEGASAPVAVTNNYVMVSDLLFSNFSRPNTPNIVTVAFTLTSLTAGQGDPYSLNFQGSAGLRQ